MMKNVLFQLHWFFGITAGLILAIMGVTGAIYSYEDSMIKALNPATFVVEKQADATLTPSEIYQRISQQHPEQSIKAVTVAASATQAAMVTFADPNNRRGKERTINPYTAELLPEARGEDFFHFIEDLHRNLTMGKFGKQLTGISTIILIYFVLTGLYLRWPRKSSIKEWLLVKPRLKGRSFLWNLHSVVGTWVVVFYLIIALTGLTWSYSWYRAAAYKVMGVEAPVRGGTPGAGGERGAGQPHPATDASRSNGSQLNGSPNRSQLNAGQSSAPQTDAMQANNNRINTTNHNINGRSQNPRGSDERSGRPEQAALDIPVALQQGWQVFNREVSSYSTASFRLPERGSTLEVSFMDANPQHERARNSLKYNVATSQVEELSFYKDKPLNEKIMGSLLPVHRGSFFGPVWQFLTLLAALSMPLFFITGWMLYLKRRQQKKLTKAAQQLTPMTAANQVPWLVVYASQTGFAEQLAWRTAQSLQLANIPAQVIAIDQLSASQLSQTDKALFIVSTFGQGEAPDHARRFAKYQLGQSADLSQLSYAVLALGDKEYQTTYCAFGQQLDSWLSDCNANALFERVEVNYGNPADLERWNQALSQVTHSSLSSMVVEKVFDAWRLSQRNLLNPQSTGEPAFEVRLEAQHDASWAAGDIAEIQPGNSDARIQDFLTRHQLNAQQPVHYKNQSLPLAEALRYLNLTGEFSVDNRADSSAQHLIEQLSPLPTREYSIASLPQDGYLSLVVRQTHFPQSSEFNSEQISEQGFGLGSGWLTAHATVGENIALRIRTNESFHAPDDNRPLILIGNGTGIAGLLSLLKQRQQHQFNQNWLIFGERQREHDFFFADQLNHWLATQHLQRLDLAFSRDQSEKVYVQHCLLAQQTQLQQWIAQGASIYVCGSIEGMAPAVDAVLNQILGEACVEQLAAEGRYRRDVY